MILKLWRCMEEEPCDDLLCTYTLSDYAGDPVTWWRFKASLGVCMARLRHKLKRERPVAKNLNKPISGLEMGGAISCDCMD